MEPEPQPSRPAPAPPAPAIPASPAPQMEWTGLFERRGPLLAVLAAAILLGALIHPFPEKFAFRYGGDCVRYLTWSRVVAQKWLFAFPGLVDEYRNKWVGFPPPTRWAWLLSIAAVMRLWPAASDEYHPLVLLSWLGAVLAVIPLGLWLRRRAPSPVVAIALLLTATAPLSRAMGHFPLPDALHTTICIFMLAFTAEWLRQPRRWVLWALGVTTLAAISTRETGIINILGAAAMVVADAWSATPTGQRFSWRTIRYQPLVALLGGCVAMVLITLPLAGGPKQLVLLAYDVVHAALFTSGALMYCSGPYYRYLVDFMVVSPVLTVTALASIGPLRRRPDLGALTLHVLVPSVVVLGLFSLLSKTLRYVMVVDTGMRVLAAMAVWSLWSAAPSTAQASEASEGGAAGGQRSDGGVAGTRLGKFLALALLVALVAHDIGIYKPLWGKDQIYDPVTWGLTKYLRMIPNWGPGPPVD